MSEEIEPLLPGIKLESPTNNLVSHPSTYENENVEDKRTALCGNKGLPSNSSDSENSADETCIKIPMSSETSETDDTGELGIIISELPEGKKYHLFVSHATEDKDKVDKICLHLRNRFRFKCLNYDSDFVGGVSLEKNIKLGIEQSVKMVLMISPSFFERPWCVFEAHEALTVVTKTKSNCVIPVLLRQTENDLPGYLKHLRYIDAEKESDVAAKIYDAFHFSDEFTRKQENQVYSKEEMRNQNGARLLSKEAIRLAPFCTRGHVYAIPEIDTQDEDLLVPFPKSEEQLRIAISCVNDHALMKHNRVFVGGGYTILASTLLSVIALALVAGGYVLEIIIKRQFDDVSMFAIIAGIGLAAVAWFGSFLGFVLIRRKLTTKLRTDLWCVNSEYFETTKCLVIFDNTLLNKPCLTVVRYDTTECKRYLSILLKIGCITLGEEIRERHADDMIKSLLRNMQVNGFLCNWLALDEYDYNRHNTWLRKKCLCQILEGDLIKSVVIV